MGDKMAKLTYQNRIEQIVPQMSVELSEQLKVCCAKYVCARSNQMAEEFRRVLEATLRLHKLYCPTFFTKLAEKRDEHAREHRAIEGIDN